MSIDRSFIGREFPPVSLLVTRSRLRNFAKATGQDEPVYTDVDVAKQAGYRDLPVPPTFFFGIELEAPDPFAFVTELGVDLRTVLHGEQKFAYERAVDNALEQQLEGKISREAIQAVEAAVYRLSVALDQAIAPNRDPAIPASAISPG